MTSILEQWVFQTQNDKTFITLPDNSYLIFSVSPDNCSLYIDHKPELETDISFDGLHISMEAKFFDWNCLQGGEIPKWELYNNIEVLPCINLNSDAEEPCLVSVEIGGGSIDENGQIDGEEIACWTVFGHLKEGGLEDLRDCKSKAEAELLYSWCMTQLPEVI